MLNTKFLQKIEADYSSRGQARIVLITEANGLLRLAKLAIFALQRDDQEKAKKHFEEAECKLSVLSGLVKQNPLLSHEGTFRAALEELVEAEIFSEYCAGRPIQGLTSKALSTLADSEIILSGLADAGGEAVRRAVKDATAFNLPKVIEAKEFIEQAVYFFVELDATHNLRSKFDQMKRNLQRIEDLVLELTLIKSHGK